MLSQTKTLVDFIGFPRVLFTDFKNFSIVFPQDFDESFKILSFSIRLGPTHPMHYRLSGFFFFFFFLQPCPEPVDFREHQCAAFNEVPYHDTYLKWSAHYDTNDPCALTCRGSPDNELDDNSDDEALIVVVLAPKVQDGTRCRHGSLDMCINGKCQVISWVFKKFQIAVVGCRFAVATKHASWCTFFLKKMRKNKFSFW